MCLFASLFSTVYPHHFWILFRRLSFDLIIDHQKKLCEISQTEASMFGISSTVCRKAHNDLGVQVFISVAAHSQGAANVLLGGVCVSLSTDNHTHKHTSCDVLLTVQLRTCTWSILTVCCSCRLYLYRIYQVKIDFFDHFSGFNL